MSSTIAKNIKVLVDPSERDAYLSRMLALEGISSIEENPIGVYCPISLTATPERLKPVLRARQEILKSVLTRAGLEPYDPATSKYSPDINLAVHSDEVYRVDTALILKNRFFVGHHLLPSSGFGNECEKARIFNRASVVLHDRAIRVSRMEPYRTIYLGYDNFEKEADRFVELFIFLQQFSLGMGIIDETPVLIGAHKKTGDIVSLEEAVYTEFPDLVFEYDGDVPIVKLDATNSNIFYEHNI